jgi:hypothetical protein
MLTMLAVVDPFTVALLHFLLSIALIAAGAPAP